MLVTGIFLWWPQKMVQGNSARLRYKRRHSLAGIAFALVSIGIILTGLTWSRYTGEAIKQLATSLGQNPRLPTPAVLSRQSHVPQMNWQSAWDAAKNAAPVQSSNIRMHLAAPDLRSAQKASPWRIQNFERTHPTLGFQLALQPQTGAVLHARYWRDLTFFQRATAIGIPFHRGELGLWNQLLLVGFALALIVSICTGWRMVWLRVRSSNR